MPKTLFKLMEEAQKYTIVEVLYFKGDMCSTKEKSKKVATRGSSRPTQGMSKRPHPNKGKKNMFNRYTSFMTTQKEILNQVEDLIQ